MVLLWGNTGGRPHHAADVLPSRSIRHEANHLKMHATNVSWRWVGHEPFVLMWERLPHATRDLNLSQKLPLCDTTIQQDTTPQFSETSKYCSVVQGVISYWVQDIIQRLGDQIYGHGRQEYSNLFQCSTGIGGGDRGNGRR